MKNRSVRPYTDYDAGFTAKVAAWQPFVRGVLAAFGRARFDRLCARDRAFAADGRTVVFLTFENRYAPLGGLAAVMRYLPAYLKKSGESVVLLTPLYTNIPAVKVAIEKGALERVVEKQPFRWVTGVGDGYEYAGTVCCYRDVDAPVDSYYIGIDGRFTAELNPYSYGDPGEILDDSLAFCAAAPFVLGKLGIDKNILFHAHDWETAPIAVTAKLAMLTGMLDSARTVLTMHNSFDSGIDAERKRMFFGDGVPGDTVLQCAIPQLCGPLTTVSTPFAQELRGDPMQRTVFTDHLQDVFAVNPPVGVENGMFGRPYIKYTYGALSRARQGVPDKLLSEKARFRDRMLAVVAGMDHPGVVGGLRDVGDGKPVFFMSGRLDLMQKGFDVIFRAIEKFPVGKSCLIFCPSSAEGEKHSAALAFFRDIIAARQGDIVMWPFRISSEDYESVLLGSSFLLMPSFYEPFGAATEGFMHGTPVVARATGGLRVQVRATGSDATGILYREYGGTGSATGFDDDLVCRGWKEILSTPVADRAGIPLYGSMVDEAHAALTAAADVFADSEAYGRMILNGIDSLKSFSWDIAVNKYRRVYDIASRRGFFDA